MLPAMRPLPLPAAPPTPLPRELTVILCGLIVLLTAATVPWVGTVGARVGGPLGLAMLAECLLGLAGAGLAVTQRGKIAAALFLAPVVVVVALASDRTDVVGESSVGWGLLGLVLCGLLAFPLRRVAWKA